MISGHFSIISPFAVEFKTLFYTFWHLTENKNVEVQLYRTHTLFDFSFHTHLTGRDHGGIRIGFGLFSYNIEIELYDSRHWDHQNKCWLEPSKKLKTVEEDWLEKTAHPIEYNEDVVKSILQQRAKEIKH